MEEVKAGDENNNPKMEVSGTQQGDAFLLPLPVRKLETLSLAVSNISLLILMGITCADVACRYFLGQALGWVYDTSLVFMVIIVFASMATVQSENSNVRMELILIMLSARIKRRLILIHNIIGLFVFGFIGLKGAGWALQAAKKGWIYGLEAPIPVWVPYTAISFGSLLLCLRFLLEILIRLRGGDRRISNLRKV